MNKKISSRLAKWGSVAALSLFPFLNAQAVTVDLLVLYDTASNNHFNGQAATAIQGWVNQANTMHQNSGTDIQLRLVGALHYDAAGNDMGQVLGNIRTNAWINERRNALGADFVTQVHRTGACGLGYVAVHRDWAYNVTGPTCGGQVLAHELGHNMGLNHSRKQGDQSGARYRYGVGHGVDGVFATIMAYPGVFNAPWMTRFSSPNGNCNGLPCGVPAGQPAEADASRALAEVKNDIANFMPTRVGGGTTTRGSGVCMYADANYTGERYCVGESAFNLPGNWNDRVSSVTVDSGLKVEFFEHSNYTGASVAYTGDVNFVGAGFNDKATSIRVTKTTSANPAYLIKAKHSGKCLDIAGWSTANGAEVLQWSCHGGNNQRFRVYDAGKGYWQIQSKHSGKCLDVWGAATQSGAQVRQGDCHGGDNQKLNPANHGGNLYQLGFKHSGICLDINGGSGDNGAKVIQSSCHAGDNQRFYFERVE